MESACRLLAPFECRLLMPFECRLLMPFECRLFMPFECRLLMPLKFGKKKHPEYKESVDGLQYPDDISQ